MSPPPGRSRAPDGTKVNRTVLHGPACGRRVHFGMDTASGRPETLGGEARHAALQAPVLCPHHRRHGGSNRGGTSRLGVRGVPCRCMANCNRSGSSVRPLVTKSSGCRSDSGEVRHAPMACGPRRAWSCGCPKAARRQRGSFCCVPCPEIGSSVKTWTPNSMPPPTAHRMRSACD